MYWIIPLMAVSLPLGLYVFASVSTAKRLTDENTYACPNCGHRFKIDWKQFMSSNPGFLFRKYNYNTTTAWLKCPKCNIRDICKKPYDY